MVRDLRSGTVSRRLHASRIAKKSSTVRSSFKATLFQATAMVMASQRLIQMDSLLPLKSRAPMEPRLDRMPNGGPTETVKALRNGTVLKKPPASATARTSSTRRYSSKEILFQALIMKIPSQALTQWASPSFKKVSDYFEIISHCFCCCRNSFPRQSCAEGRDGPRALLDEPGRGKLQG